MRKNRIKFQNRLAWFAAAILSLIALCIFLYEPGAGMGIGATLATVPIWGSFAAKTFKVLNPEQIAGLELEDQVKYFNELNLYKAEQVDNLKAQIKLESKAELKEQLLSLREEIMADNKAQMETLYKTIDGMGLAINKLMSRSTGVASQKSIEDYLYEKADELKGANNNKVSFTIDKTVVTTASVESSPFALDVPGVPQLPTRKLKIRDLFAKGTVADGQGGVVRYIDMKTATRAAAWRAENADKPESAVVWITRTMTLETVADTIPMSNQSLTNIPFMAAEIRNFLLRNLDIKIDADLFSGSGSTPIIKGAFTSGTAFTAAASSITDANVYDLISQMKDTAEADTPYECNYVIIRPSDKTKYMTVKKDGNNNYILPPFVEMLAGKMYIHGMEVIASNAVTAGDLLVGDFNYGTVYTHGGVKVDIGMIDKQFIENAVTVRAEEELGLLIRVIHAGAFQTSTDIAADIATLASDPA